MGPIGWCRYGGGLETLAGVQLGVERQQPSFICPHGQTCQPSSSPIRRALCRSHPGFVETQNAREHCVVLLLSEQNNTKLQAGIYPPACTHKSRVSE